MIVSIDVFINMIIWCLLLPDFDEFSMCIDNVVLEYNMSLEWKNL